MYVQLYPKDQYCLLSLMRSFTHCHIHITTNTTITHSRSNNMSRPSPICDLSEHMLIWPILCYDCDGLLSVLSRLAYIITLLIYGPAIFSRSPISSFGRSSRFSSSNCDHGKSFMS